jgi:hypothetical protein
MLMDASMATLRPKSVLMSCSCMRRCQRTSVSLRQLLDSTVIALGACSLMSAVSPLMPMVIARDNQEL